MAEKVGVPTVSGLKDAAMAFGICLGGGVLYALSTALVGSGLIGGLIGAGIAGAALKGARGTALATILGFQTIVGSAVQAGAGATSAERGVM